MRCEPNHLNFAIFTTKVSRGKLTVQEYIDLSTGEVIPADVASKLGIRVIRPDAGARRLVKLDRLRVEPRRFAVFLLSFRDSHCKFLVPVEEILKWYSKMTGAATHNIRRYLPKLIEAGILDSDTELNKDFMINNPSAGRAEVKGDMFRAYNTLAKIELRHTQLKRKTINPLTL